MEIPSLANPKKVLTRQLIYIAVLIFVLGAITTILSLQISSYAHSIESLRLESEQKGTEIENLAKLNTQYEQVRGYFASLQTLLPTKEHLISFDRDLELVARDTGVNFQFQTRGETPGSDSSPGTLMFEISLRGGLTNIVSFLDRLQQLNYLISLGPPAINQSGGGYTVTFSGQVYTQ